MSNSLTPEMLLAAYSQGLFPMADSADSKEVYWYDPEMRGQLSIENLHVPKRLKKTIRQEPYDISLDTAFEEVINKCAEQTIDRSETWINKTIIDGFVGLHKLGFAHSVEAWDRETGELVGGSYGIGIGAVFCGESMFSRSTDASKIALVYLIAHLKVRGYKIFDTQYTNDHLKQFGVYEISKIKYKKQLIDAIQEDIGFYSGAFLTDLGLSLDLDSVSAFLQSISQTSKTG